MAAVFEDIDVLITPTTAFPAPELGQARIAIDGREVPVRGTLGRFTAPFSFVGLPAISVPCGFSDTGMPIGLQLAGRPFDELTVLRAAHAYEQATDWHTRRPPI